MDSHENDALVGLIILVIGLVGLIATHYFRPVAEIGQLLSMLAEDKKVFIREPYYQIMLLGNFAYVVVGAFFIYRAKKAK